MTTSTPKQKPGLGNEALSVRHGAEAWDHRLEPVGQDAETRRREDAERRKA